MSQVAGRVVVLDRLVDLVEAAALLPGRRVTAADEVPTGADVVALVAGPGTPVTAADLDRLPGLRVLASTSAGTDHLPLAACAARGLPVTTTAGYCTEEVADHALTAVLAVLRRVPALEQLARAGRWDGPLPGCRRIAGSVLGLVGGGATAAALARRAVALGMQVRVWTRRPGQLPGVTRVPELLDLAAGVDVLSLHVPLTEQTRGLVDAQLLAALPRGSGLVNVARGGLVDSAALAAALRSGHLAAAAVDVLTVEPPPPGEPLLHAPNLLLTPHAAWFSAAAARRAGTMSVESVAAALG